MALHGTTSRLLVVQRLHVVDDHCETLSYHYRFSLSDHKASWVLRWEYVRTPETEEAYPPAHVHVNGSLALEDLPQLPRLHVPTARVPLELVLWHLITDWGIQPKHGNWRETLEESIAGFEARRRAS